ncbi:hypothetical protein [Bdellovibrio bacteriovorus]|uniref:hypothetical protein n=1 Tax=Bdellovibrio bacteriovorus TaxID=959 RepID=UPI0035A5839A
MKNLIFFTLFLSVSFANARSTEFGNGGKGIVCKETHQVFFYDTYESKQRYNLTPELEDVTDSICDVPETRDWEILTPCLTPSLELAEKSLDKIKAYDPIFAAELSLLLGRFALDALFVNGTLSSTDDVGLSFVPAGCELQQLAIQHVKEFEEDYTYFISKPLWLRLRVADKVALLMHEVVYKAALKINPHISSSEKVRYFSSHVLAKAVLTRQKYEQIKKSLLGQNPEVVLQK